MRDLDRLPQLGNLKRAVGVFAAAASCCLPASLLAADSELLPDSLLVDSHSRIHPGESFVPFPLRFDESRAGLAFDLGESNKRKLQLQLSQPFSHEWFVDSRWLDTNSKSVLAGTRLEYSLNDQLSLNSQASLEKSNYSFQALGSIHCQNGVLAADSYRASDCHFINDRSSLTGGTVSLGAEYRLDEFGSARFNLFHRESSLGLPVVGGRNPAGGAASLDPGLLSATPVNPLFPGFIAGQALQSVDTEVTGIDLEFQLGVSTDKAGDMRLGLQLTRVMDGSYDGAYFATPGIHNWTIAKPFDSARLSFDWNKGSFSGGVQSFYREPVEFFNRNQLNAYTTFDVHFTWRAPWNASLSVGASNLLNSGVDDTNSAESKLADPFESVYGRIPYVRYKQDL